MENASQPILQGWKQIAAYIGRDIRTVQRWESQRGLPVRRLPGDGRAAVYAFVPEMDEWLSRTTPAEEEPAGTVASPPGDTAASIRPAETDAAEASASSSWRRSWTAAATLAASVLLVCAYVAHISSAAHLPKDATAARVPPAVEARTISTVPGVEDLYFRGVYLLEQRTPVSLAEAESSFQSVLRADPDNANAWAELAQTYVLMYEYNLPAGEVTFASTEEAARHAIALDPRLADAHTVLGFINFFWRGGNVRAAEPEFRTAISLAPQSATAHSWYGAMLTFETRYTEALGQLEMARHLEPASQAILANLALATGLSGDRQKGLRMLQEAGQDHPIGSVRRYQAILCSISPRDIPCYLDENLAIAESHKDTITMAVFVAAEDRYRQQGEAAMWHEIASRVQPDAGTEFRADADAVLGRNDAAVQDLEYQKQHSGTLRSLAMDPLLVSLHRDARFERLLAEAGLPPVH